MGLFKKSKKSKEPEAKIIGKSEDGTPIYEYSEIKKTGWTIPTFAEHMEEIEEYMNNQYPGRETIVLHEIFSDIVHIDVHVMKPTEEDPYYVVYTTGMSALKMNVPKMKGDSKEDYELAELMIYLPENWDFSEDEKAGMKEESYWIIDFMKFIARFPHEYKTFFSGGHTIPNGGDYEPFVEGTGLSGVLLLPIHEFIEIQDGSKVNMLFMMLTYKEEMEYKLKKGYDALIQRFEEEDIPFILDLKRKNVCV